MLFVEQKYINFNKDETESKMEPPKMNSVVECNSTFLFFYETV